MALEGEGGRRHEELGIKIDPAVVDPRTRMIVTAQRPDEQQ
jgi:hypothetical protein